MGHIARRFLPVLVVVGFACGALAATASAVSFQVMSGNGSLGGTDSQVTYNDASQSPTSGAAFIVTPNPAWATPLGSSQWVSSASNTNSASNPTYETSFNLPANAGSPSVSVSWLTDNQATVSIDGGSPQGAPLGGCPQDFVAGTEQTTTAGLQPGANTLLFATNNCNPPYGDFGSNPSGLDFVASVTYTPEPVTEDQCEGGNWQNLVDSNGNPFGSSLACQLAATGLMVGSLPHGGVCNGIVVVGAINGDVQVPPGGTCGLSSAATVSHDVRVDKGGTLYSSAPIGHDLTAHQPAQIDLDSGSVVKHDVNIDGLMGGSDNEICGTTVGHDLTVRNTSGAAGIFQIGCPEEGGGNTVGHDLVVENNAGAVTVNGNSAGHEARCHHNDAETGSGNTPASSTCNSSEGGPSES